MSFHNLLKYIQNTILESQDYMINSHSAILRQLNGGDSLLLTATA